MRYLLSLTLLILALVPGMRATAADGAVMPAYKIASDDVLDITVQDHTDLSKAVTVLPDGSISYPYLGELVVSGMTLRAVSERITVALRKQITDPIVTITVKSLHERAGRMVSILGAVKSPGKRTLKDGWKILDVIAECGGLTVDRPELVSATLIRGGSETISVDLIRVLSVADPKANITLMADDVLLVHELDSSLIQAQVMGEVARPGFYYVPKDGAVSTFINEAGGFTPKAALSKATLTHAGKTTDIDLRSLLVDGHAAGIKIVPGDKLYIPQNRLFYALIGAVGHTGMQDYPEDKTVTVLSALTMAGVQSSGANLKSVSVIHPTKDGKPSIVVVNVEIMLKKGDTSKDVTLLPGDIVYVPSKSQRSGVGIGDALGYLSLFHIF